MATVKKILIVDDDKDILSLLKYNFEKEGYKVVTSNRASHTMRLAMSFSPDLIILDIMMPDKNGIDICRELRNHEQFRNTYIFFLTAKSESYLQSAAFDTGGDDYIEKITGLRALIYKISTVLKDDLIIRKRQKDIVIGNLKLYRDDLSIAYADRKVFLPRFEFELLFFLAQNPKHVITKDHLIHNIWGSEIFLLSRSLEAYIDNIKSKVHAPVIKKIDQNGFKLNVA